MQLILDLIHDETGSVVSTESVIVGTVAIAGTTAGMNATSQAIDSELAELASAIRQLDQSFTVSKERSSKGWSAGSSYTQPRADTAVEMSNCETEPKSDARTENSNLLRQNRASLFEAPARTMFRKCSTLTEYQ